MCDPADQLMHRVSDRFVQPPRSPSSSDADDELDASSPVMRKLLCLPGSHQSSGGQASSRLLFTLAKEKSTSGKLTEARTVGDRVLAVFELRSASGSPTTSSSFAARFGVDADQLLRMALSRDRKAALDDGKHRAEQPT